MWSKQVLSPWFCVELGVMVMKGFLTAPISPELMLPPQIQFNYPELPIFFFLEGRGLTPYQGI